MFKSKKTINITGGLGNQLFQYAYGRKLEIIDKKQVIFNTSFFYGSKPEKDTPRPFLLNKFNINPQAVFTNTPENTIIKFFKKIFYKITGLYPLYQSEKYFIQIKDTILEEITLKESLSKQADDILKNIKLEKNSISIHIRRGDYINNPNHNVCDLNYYYKAIEYIKTKIQTPIFYIFSDDMEWVKNNLKTENAIYISNPNLTECEEIILMSKCSHNIIANSTFSWWAAYLNTNPNKIIIAPKQWTNKKTANDLVILPPTWIQI